METGNTTPSAAGLVAADEQDVADDLGGTQSTHAVGCKFQHSPSARTPEKCRTTSHNCVALKQNVLYTNKKTEMRQRSLPHRESSLIARSCKFSLLPRLFTLTRRSAIHAFKASVDRPHRGTLGAGCAQAPFLMRCLAPPETARTRDPRLPGSGALLPWGILTSRRRGGAAAFPVGSGRLLGASPPRTQPRGR